METKELSTCFCTNDVEKCKDYYQRHFGARIEFDCGWYVNMRIGSANASIQFMQPQGEMPTFQGAGVTLNFNVQDVDAEYERLTGEGLEVAMPLDDHPWGDRGFSVVDPIGNAVYIYSEREPSEEFRKFHKG